MLDTSVDRVYPEGLLRGNGDSLKESIPASGYQMYDP